MWLVLLIAGCATPLPVADTGLSPPRGGSWPERTAPLTDLDLALPSDFGVHRIAIDPGHGTGSNTGTRTVTCEDEADVMLDLAEDLALRLRATGGFEVMLTREEPDGPSYRARLDAATAFGAEALVSLHLDARGASWGWQGCWRSDEAPGFAVLVADRGDEALVEERLTLARSVADAMATAGFGVYDGLDYGGLYDRDPIAGVYLDRRVLMMLRRPTMPSILIETHHGLDWEERARWGEERTRSAFAAAVAVGLAQALGTPP